MIQNKRDRQADKILQQILTLPESEHAAFLERSCSDDPALHALVERLVAQATADDARLRPGGGLRSIGVETHDFARLPVSPFAPGDQVGAFRLVRVLGRGGMATVYLAERADGQFEQTVAVKILDRRGETLARFEQERQILASLDHPNISRLLDGGLTEHGIPYVAMEYIEGEGLLEYCDRERLSIRQRLELFQKIVDAVHYAHRRLIVHRDIKSANILVTVAGIPKLLDFGIAKLLETDALPHAAPATRVAAPMTPEYASPEQIRGEPMTVAADIYQLGYLLFALLTGQSPYDSGSTDMAALVDAIIRRDPAAPSRRIAEYAESESVEPPWLLCACTRARLQRHLRGDLDRVALKALHKDPEQRYASASVLAADIENVLNDRPVVARPDSVRYRTRKFVRRNALPVAIAAAAVLTLVISASSFTYRLAQARVQAQLEADKANEVATFMRGLFASANPQVTAGVTLSAREVLDSGLERLHDRLDAQPEVKAELLHSMGYAYRELGSLEVAEEVLQESLKLRAATKGTENADYLETLRVMADLHRAQGRYVQAEKLARQAVESSQRILGDEAPQTHYAMAVLGLAIYRQSRFREAEEIHRRRLALTRQYLGAEHPDVVGALNNVGAVLYMQGRYEEALEFLEPAHRIGARELGDKHPATLNALNNIALNYQSQARYRESADVYERVIALRASALGKEHPATLRSRQNLATLLVVLGDNSTAIPLLEDLADVRTRVLGREHPDTLWTQQDLARSYAAVGRLEESESMLRTLLAQRIDLLGEGHYDSIRSRYYLGSVLRQHEKYDEAERQLQKTLDLRNASENAHVGDILFDLLELGLVYLESNQIERAEQTLQTAIDQLDSTDRNPNLRGVLLKAWGETLRLRGRLEESETALLESLKILSSIYGGDHELVATTAGSLAALYESWQKPKQGALYRAMADRPNP